MTTVTKTIRIDERFIDIINEYNKLVKDMMNVAPTVNNVLTTAVVDGFTENLQIFRMLANATEVKCGNGEKWNEEIKQRGLSLVEKYEQYQFEYKNEMSDEIETNEPKKNKTTVVNI